MNMLTRKCAAINNVVLSLSLLVLTSLSSAQTHGGGSHHSSTHGLVSPCPEVFSYDAPEQDSGRWYGVINIATQTKLVGFILDVKLNKHAHLLGNWLGEVESEDNIKFSITSETKRILPGRPASVRIFVKHDTDDHPPQVVTIKLNGRRICPRGLHRPNTRHLTMTFPEK